MDPSAPDPSPAYRITIEAPSLQALQTLTMRIAAGFATDERPAARAPWSPGEDRVLLAMRDAAAQWTEIAARLGRPLCGVQQRHAKLAQSGRGNVPPTR